MASPKESDGDEGGPLTLPTAHHEQVPEPPHHDVPLSLAHFDGELSQNNHSCQTKSNNNAFTAKLSVLAKRANLLKRRRKSATVTAPSKVTAIAHGFGSSNNQDFA